jgi:hypothetical protein
MSDIPYDSTQDTLAHIKEVQKLLGIVVDEFNYRAEKHDKSKLESPEKETFDIMTPKLKNSTYGSEEYKGFLKEMGIALDHHYQNNDHHPEYFGLRDICVKTSIEDGLDGHFKIEQGYSLDKMDMFQIMEMLCDWYAASKRHSTGDLFKSIEINQKRFNYSDEMKELLKKTAKKILILEESKLIDKAISEGKYSPFPENL